VLSASIPKQRYRGGHAFPPDCGQGVNAGFQDVTALDRALRGQDILSGRDLVKRIKKLLLGDALQAYQKNRGPEHKALVQLSRYFAPYQYKLHRRRDEICAFFWSLNVKFRGWLNKATFGLFPTAVYFIAQNYDFTFRKVMFRANIGSLTLQLLVCFALVPFFCQAIQACIKGDCRRNVVGCVKVASLDPFWTRSAPAIAYSIHHKVKSSMWRFASPKL